MGRWSAAYRRLLYEIRKKTCVLGRKQLLSQEVKTRVINLHTCNLQRWVSGQRITGLYTERDEDVRFGMQADGQRLIRRDKHVEL